MTDERARELTLDVTRSFIVQAPAGSGKTELLIQRYLALLGSADLPEEVLAITFTRKAAAEMRQRVLSALADAATGQVPETPHRVTTHRLATAALVRSRALEWTLELQPQRLRIETVDSLNAWLARRLSLLAGGIGAADLVEDPGSCYELAVARVLDSVGEATGLGGALAKLLRATGNSPRRLERMLRDLLPTRDQWLPYLAAGNDDELRQTLESAARRLIDEALQRLHACLPVGFADEVASILREIAADRTDHDSFSVWRLQRTELKPAVESLDAWRTVPDLLLTRARNGSFRKSWSAVEAVAVGAATRRRLENLAATYAHDDGLRRALLAIRELPEPSYAEHDWALVTALRTVLTQLVAELKVIFGERHCADFVEVALSAQQALGRVDEPSELLLALDRRLRHVLVDEFQDTSHTQFRLLELLTSGWQPGDGRTLFLVGDPMQSIYRFRHADMSLFLKAQTSGFGDIELTPLILDRNFRSAPGIVDWINTTFAGMFPAVDDIGAGIARFNACRATREEVSGQRIFWHALRSRTPSAEVERVAEILRDELLARPQGSAAVLVRSRTHLIGLRERLNGLGIRARAVEVEAPNQKQVVQDLLGLTRALSHLGDRVAWLGVLRAPWCGLSWSELEAIASASSNSAVWNAIQSDELLAKLSEDGRARVHRTGAILRRAFAARADRAFDRWVERTWIALGGPACLDQDEDPQSVAAFFRTLASVADRGDVPDPAAIERHFLEPRGQGEVPRASGVEVMTIHRAKGLE
ncbi:MAG TPA: UvrD-helicase domain-containing protein, partial [Gammaproteobacteria bacterium]|nr:UvrD-helicase domain-containing protein [Gammaproteobacteria bacterium]